MNEQHTAPNGITYTVHTAKVVLRDARGQEVYLWHDGNAQADLAGQVDPQIGHPGDSARFREAARHVSSQLRYVL